MERIDHDSNVEGIVACWKQVFVRLMPELVQDFLKDVAVLREFVLRLPAGDVVFEHIRHDAEHVLAKVMRVRNLCLAAKQTQ